MVEATDLEFFATHYPLCMNPTRNSDLQNVRKFYSDTTEGVLKYLFMSEIMHLWIPVNLCLLSLQQKDGMSPNDCNNIDVTYKLTEESVGLVVKVSALQATGHGLEPYMGDNTVFLYDTSTGQTMETDSRVI